jgi:glycolate oxidase iron-sulfur subunit
LQISKHLEKQGKEMKVMHPMELLDLAIRGVKLICNL